MDPGIPNPFLPLNPALAPEPNLFPKKQEYDLVQVQVQDED